MMSRGWDVRVSWALVAGLLVGAWGAVDCLAAEKRLLAVLGHAASASPPPPGWAFFWNPRGGLDEPQAYEPLQFDPKAVAYGVPREGGGFEPRTPGSNRHPDVYGVTDPSGAARYYIAAYTLQEDAAGDVWIHHGNLRNKGFGTTELIVQVNDDRRFELTAPQDPVATLFQHNLGSLKRGDIIRVAVGPAAGQRTGGGRLHFTLEDHPRGQSPGEPSPIVAGPITSAQPRWRSDGEIDPAYLEQHRKQCDEMLARKPRLVFLGDSITARWPPEMLEEKFGPYRPVKLGIGGDWIQNVRWRVEHGVFDRAAPDLVVLMIGTNNLSHGFTGDQIAEGIAGIAEAIRAKAPEARVLIQGILPRGSSIQGERNDEARRANAQLAALADDRAVFYLDVTDALVDGEGNFKPEVMRPDQLHVATPGYVLWIEKLQPVLIGLFEGGTP